MRLKKIFIIDVGRVEDPLTLDGKWFTLDAEENEVVEKYSIGFSIKVGTTLL